jgi:hypothetical protein
MHDVNRALMILLPKTDEATSVRDYRPIALIYIVEKLFSKVLATKLANLIHPSQSAFIKGRFI